ncbi:hypothetical protein [Halospeciosus flavus]|uniref:Small CPxCG-related zinc finger protein n=1 Tax=Halospeciosus flavus TaxID=3032283 RepID=A0ABD5Z8Y7_9EURY|nr:hypothetical protein [Halospeciosus flavus]
MVSSRTATALVGLLASLAISVVAWVYFDTLFLFLFVPFIPFLLSRGGETPEQPPVRECPTCGFRTRDPNYDYCPRDGTELDVVEDAGDEEWRFD